MSTWFAVTSGGKPGVYASRKAADAALVSAPIVIPTSATAAASPSSSAALSVSVLPSRECAVPLCVGFPLKQEADKWMADVGDRTVVYTDGACRGNGRGPSSAGSGVFWGPDDPRNQSVTLAGSRVTNIIAELKAVDLALDAVMTHPEKVAILTDSMYTIDAVCNWYSGFVHRGWVTKGTRQPVANKALIMSVHDKLKAAPHVILRHIKAHSGHVGNEAADLLAGVAAETLTQGPPGKFHAVAIGSAPGVYTAASEADAAMAGTEFPLRVRFPSQISAAAFVANVKGRKPVYCATVDGCDAVFWDVDHPNNFAEMGLGVDHGLRAVEIALDMISDAWDTPDDHGPAISGGKERDSGAASLVVVDSRQLVVVFADVPVDFYNVETTDVQFASLHAKLKRLRHRVILVHIQHFPGDTAGLDAAIALATEAAPSRKRCRRDH